MKTISLTRCKRRLATLWLVGAAMLFVLFIFLSVSGPLQGDPQQAWSWFLPSCIPTLSLMIGVYVTESRQTPGEDRHVDPFLFNIAAGVSVFYLAVILLTLLLLPRAVAPDKSADYLKMSNLWLAPVQGLATAALGAFFVHKGGTPSASPRVHGTKPA